MRAAIQLCAGLLGSLLDCGIRTMVIFALGLGLSGLIPGVSYSQGGRVEIEVLGHYTDDVEWGREEWTFEVHARDVPNLDGQDWRGPVTAAPLKNTWKGDSDPNNNDWHDLDDKDLFTLSYSEGLPGTIEVRQWGWENDVKPPNIYNSKWYGKDDDYGKGTESINLVALSNNAWQEFNWPNLRSKHGIKVRARVIRAPAITICCPSSGCRGQTNLPITVAGQHFLPGASLVISSAGVTVHDVNVDSAIKITAQLDIALLAPLGAREVRITNPGLPGIPAVLGKGFTVLGATECQ